MPLTYVNDGFVQFTGYRPKEILGRNCRFLQGKYTNPKSVKAIRDAIRAEKSVEVTLLNYKKDGTPFANSFLLLPLYKGGNGVDDREVTHFVGLQRELKVAESDVKAFAKQEQGHRSGIVEGGASLTKELLKAAPYGEQLEAILSTRSWRQSLLAFAETLQCREVVECAVELRDMIMESDAVDASTPVPGMHEFYDKFIKVDAPCEVNFSHKIKELPWDGNWVDSVRSNLLVLMFPLVNDFLEDASESQ